MALDWKTLSSDERRPAVPSDGPPEPEAIDFLLKSRREAERDYDRVLYATPTRRLADKTQVFPLEPNDSVRTRLTHSHEVSNLARSIGVHIAPTLIEHIGEEALRDVPARLAAIGLAHDLGNPPFGHKGEAAIRSWVLNNQENLFCSAVPEISKDLEKMTSAMKDDFRLFEGNAQTLRVLSRLQVVSDTRGLNLTFGTLAAVMKYTVPSDRTTSKGGESCARKKYGFFQSELPLVKKIWEKTGLEAGSRHPFAWIMEGCDDLAYLILDAEDAVKKGLVSFYDLIAHLRKASSGDPFIDWIVRLAEYEHGRHSDSSLTPAEVNDISMQMFRVHAIGGLVSALIKSWNDRYERIMNGEQLEPLLEVSPAKLFCKTMRTFDKQHAYRHRSVLGLELHGYNTLHNLMDMLWAGISSRGKYAELDSDRTSPFAEYVFRRISENYKRCFLGTLKDANDLDDYALPIRYKELQLLTDMVSGMTDGYAVKLHDELATYRQ